MASSPAPELPPDDVIREILLRLPPHPACFQRASLVCKHWRRLVRDPAFLRVHRARHRHGVQPLLGFFDLDASFVPAGEPPDRATAAHLSSRPGRTRVLGCCHGRVLLCSTLDPTQLLVWDPMTQGPLPVFMGPRRPHLGNKFVPLPIRGSFTCVHDDDDDIHGGGEDCRSRPFRVVILSCSGSLTFAGIQPGVLVGDTMYWLSPNQNRFVEYDLDTNQLRLIQGLPTDPYGPYDYYQGVKAAGGGDLGVAAVRGSHFDLFALTTDSDGTMMWTKCLGANLDEHLSPPMKPIEVSDEDGNTMLFETADGVFELELESMEVSKVLQSDVAM
ncbi:unnamed protein product [Urochloa decumbens]|uniref:F-box domain-containing protein n=1 Tax=Urochloa decumbens TaxID=240449 RepID=A0ABC8YCZ4_9POAL